MSREDALAKIKAALHTIIVWEGYESRIDGLTEDVEVHDLLDDVGADSLDEVEFIIELENQFQTEVPDKTAEAWLEGGTKFYTLVDHFLNEKETINV